MNCLRCGVEIKEGQVFCAGCLADMERHPVTPGTVVYIPKRREAQSQRRIQKRRVQTFEEQNRILRIRIRVLQILLAIFVGLTLLFINPALTHFKEEQTFLPGQNYSSYATNNTTQD